MSVQNTTPMMEQYNEIKNQYKDAILFFRLGDFYEMFNEDALEASKVLEITLTSRNKSAENPIPMCGIPHHSATQYLNKLVSAGYKVAICEQLEDPKLTKGMVRRGVIRVVTPGTIIEDGALANKENNFLASIIYEENRYYLSYIDVSTGEIYLTDTKNWEQLISEIQSIRPSELVVNHLFDNNKLETIKNSIPLTVSLHEINESKSFTWNLENPSEGERQILNLLYSYIDFVQNNSFNYIKNVERYEINNYLQMNYFTKNQLELTKSLRTQRKQGSLLWYIDNTKTAMGGRLLHQWIDKPLFNKEQLIKRHDKVDLLLNNYFERMELIPKLRNVYDLERLTAKISMNTANARDIDQLRYSLKQIPAINQLLMNINESVLANSDKQFTELNNFYDLVERIDQILVDDPPISITEGNLIKENYNQQLDKYKDALLNGEKWLAELQQREREITGLKTLKIGYNKVFGYYIEMSRLQAQDLDDSRYQRKQTLANSERYYTEELKEIETTILNAQEKSKQLEYELFSELRAYILDYTSELQILAEQIAELDVLCCFANISEKEGFVRTEITDDPNDYYLEESRHPVVEYLIGSSEFVPNDLTISNENYILLLTGPNMSGKSTFMRQIAFAVILNQIGCFVPARNSRLPLIDKIFTRIGSSDDISQGQSTFMVEMMETNYALRNATSRSLLLFDELGRGTATYDGIALAQGILYYIANVVKATTIFSTHYHELTSLEDSIQGLKNIHVGTSEQNEELVFLHQIFDGPADKSYGIHVARLAGMPETLIKQSQQILNELEHNSQRLFNKNHISEQVTLFNIEEQNTKQLDENMEIIENLKNINLDQMTPLDALLFLSELKNKL